MTKTASFHVDDVHVAATEPGGRTRLRRQQSGPVELEQDFGG
jgi:hypothetical protein